MIRVTAHITIRGVPLCRSAWAQTRNVFCSYPSLAAADRAKKEIQRHNYSVHVVRGACPE